MTTPLSPSQTADFWRLFGRALGRPLAPGRYDTTQLPEWDSLRHVELVFELEEAFGIQIAPDAIAALYTDTDTILVHLSQQLQGRG